MSGHRDHRPTPRRVSSAHTLAPFALVLVTACSASVAPDSGSLPDASLPAEDVNWLPGAVVDASDVAPRDPVVVDVRLVGLLTSPPAGLFHARIDGANGETIDVLSGAGGAVRTTVPSAFLPFDITFAGVGWTVTSILGVTADMRGEVSVRAFDSPVTHRDVDVDIAGRSTPGSRVALWANAGSYGYAWDTTTAETASPVTTTDYVDASALRIVAYELGADRSIVNAVNTVVDWPAPGTHARITFPPSPRTPERATLRFHVLTPSAGAFTGEVLRPTSSSVYRGRDQPEPFALVDVGTSRCTGQGALLECEFDTFDGDLSPQYFRLAAHSANETTALFVTAPFVLGSVGIRLPEVSSARIDGTSLGDASVEVSADGYRGAALYVWGNVHRGDVSGMTVWTVFTYGNAQLLGARWPRLPEGLTLATIGVPAQMHDVVLDTVYQVIHAADPWAPGASIYELTRPQAVVRVARTSLASDGR